MRARWSRVDRAPGIQDSLSDAFTAESGRGGVLTVLRFPAGLPSQLPPTHRSEVCEVRDALLRGLRLHRITGLILQLCGVREHDAHRTSDELRRRFVGH